MAVDSYLELVQNFANHIETASKIDATNKLPFASFNKIVISGMGGSSISGAILQSYMHDLPMPVFLSRSYALPKFVDRNTLVFVVSYSGNTEETIASLRTALGKGASVIAVTSGGKLLKKFRDEKLPFIEVPGDMQPRVAMPYLLIPILNTLGRMKLIADPAKEIKKVIETLKEVSYNDQAKNLAGKLTGKIPLIYASERFLSVAYRWKTQFNENSKIHAFSGAFSELNHNELVGYTNVNGNYHVIILEDEADHKRVKARMRLTRELISKRNVPTTQILIKGENLLTRLLSAVHIGDLTSVYLAIFNNTDPEPVQIIEDLKRQLEKIPNI